MCYISYTIAQSHVITCLFLLNQLKTQIADVTHILRECSTYLLAKTCVTFQTIFSCPTLLCFTRCSDQLCVNGVLEFCLQWNAFENECVPANSLYCPEVLCQWKQMFLLHRMLLSVSSWSNMENHILMTCTVFLFYFTSTCFIVLFCAVTFIVEFR